MATTAAKKDLQAYAEFNLTTCQGEPDTRAVAPRAIHRFQTLAPDLLPQLDHVGL